MSLNTDVTVLVDKHPVRRFKLEEGSRAEAFVVDVSGARSLSLEVRDVRFADVLVANSATTFLVK